MFKVKIVLIKPLGLQAIGKYLGNWIQVAIITFFFHPLLGDMVIRSILYSLLYKKCKIFNMCQKLPSRVPNF